MLEEIYNYFTIEMLYYWVNLGVLPFWFILIFFPRSLKFQVSCAIASPAPFLDCVLPRRALLAQATGRLCRTNLLSARTRACGSPNSSSRYAVGSRSAARSASALPRCAARRLATCLLLLWARDRVRPARFSIQHWILL